MAYTCSVCKQEVQGDLVVFKDHTEEHIVELVKYKHPEWIESDGMCEKCVEYYRNAIQGTIFKDAACAIRQDKINTFFSRMKNFFGLKK